MASESPISQSKYTERELSLTQIQQEIAREVDWQAKRRRSLDLVLDTMAQESFLMIPSHGSTKLTTSSAKYFAGIKYMSEITVRSLSKTKKPWEIFLRNDEPGSLAEKVAKELPSFIREKYPHAWGFPINVHGSLQDYRERRSPSIKVVFENGLVVLTRPNQEFPRNPQPKS